MIPQLGSPTFFVIFTNAESKWIDLLKALHEPKRNFITPIKKISNFNYNFFS
jgi:hypothetical protein